MDVLSPIWLEKFLWTVSLIGLENKISFNIRELIGKFHLYIIKIWIWLENYLDRNKNSIKFLLQFAFTYVHMLSPMQSTPCLLAMWVSVRFGPHFQKARKGEKDQI